MKKEILKIIKKQGIEELNPPQKKALKKGLLDGKNLVIASPTASGKTLISEMAMLNHVKNDGKCIYIVPLKALASEKYDEFKEKYENLGIKVAMTTGDLDSSEKWLGNYDIIITTSEKLDSLLRHSAKWIKDISLVVTDEIHLLNDPKRGPTLEIVLTKLKNMCNAQFLSLSATINNVDELADWLSAEYVKSDYRPIDLYKGTYHPDELNLEGKKRQKIKKDKKSTLALCKDTLKKKKQALIFRSTRRNAESTAKKLSKNLNLKSKDLVVLSKKIKNALSSPTKQCKKLAKCIEGGAAFHHAGLVYKQRKLIEDAFKKGHIKFIAATPTLAAGINLPAFRVIIRDQKRFDGYGMNYISVLEIQQMQGRAGRPKYDTEGEAILIAKNKNDAKKLWEKYIEGEPEPIFSKLAVEPVLRMHVLALIAENVCESDRQLKTFFDKTFFAHQYDDLSELHSKLENVTQKLKEYNFLEKGDDFIKEGFEPAFDLEKEKPLKATQLGKRVAQLYIDPKSANYLIKNMGKKKDFEYLQMINSTLEMKPLLRVKGKEESELEERVEDKNIKTPEVWSIEYEEFLKKFKTSLLLEAWINEKKEDYILENFKVAPGGLYYKKKNAEWLFYAAKELALILNKKEMANEMNKMLLRIKHGVKQKLLPLIRIKNVGRIRARKLYKNGIKTRSQLKRSKLKLLERMFGKKTARKLKASSK